MEALQAIQEFSGLNKSEINTLAKAAVDSVFESGNPLEAAEILSVMEDFVKSVKADKRFTEYVREEAGKHGRQFISPSGAKIEPVETGTTYDYSKCEDQEYNVYKSNLEYFKQKVKEKEEFLKTVPVSGLIVTEEESGNTYKVYPPSKTSTSSYKITLAK